MSTHFDSTMTKGNDPSTQFFSTMPKLWNVLTEDHVVAGLDASSPLVVPCKLAKSAKDSIGHTILATDVPSAELTSALAKMHLSESSAATVKEVVLNDKMYYLVPISATDEKYSMARLSRQWGLTLAAHLPEMIYQMATLSFAETTHLSYAHVLDGLIQGLYKSTGYKGTASAQDITLKSWCFPPSAFAATAAEEGLTLSQAVQLAKAKLVTRHLGDTPANLLTPMEFAKVAMQLGQMFNFKVTTYDHHQLKEQGMNSMLSVAQGSPNPPRMICCEIAGSADYADTKPVVFIGKGVTFDSGGLSLKPPGGMMEMKYDMLGGGTVMGAMCYLATLPAHYPVVALIGCVENMPAYFATRPGDVVKSMGGKTIEVLNTDAEGRLVMADLFGYAQKHHPPKFMLDVATLTGACLYALGRVGAALMSTEDSLAQYLLKGAAAVGEPLWQLPLWQDLSKCMASSVADVKNISSAQVKAGTITAGIFLSKFVDDDLPWAHFDIAGTGYNSLAYGYPSKGASAYGVEVLAWAARHAHQL